MRDVFGSSTGFQPVQSMARVENPCYGWRIWAMGISLMLSGCAPFTRAQMELVTQARKGVAGIAKRADERAASVRELAAVKRQRLDEAFDADVRGQDVLDANWVIDHRKAYEVGVDAYAKQQAAEDAAALAEKRDLEAVDTALQRLYWLQSVQVKFDFVEEVLHGHD